MYYKPVLSKPYSQADLEAILADAIRVLDKLGVACEDPATVETLTATPGICHEAGRLRFSTQATREHMEEVWRIAQPETEEPPFVAKAPWCCLNYADPQTGEVRPATTQDAILATRMMDARGDSDWPVPVIPSDVNPRHQTLRAEWVAIGNSRYLGGFMPATDFTEIEFLIEMNQAAGRTYQLVEQIGISPLRFNDHGLAAANHFVGRKDVAVRLVGPIPAVGSTCPFPLRSAMVQTVAESLALSVTIARLGLGTGGFGAVLEPMDFQYMTMTFGSVEEMLYALVTAQMSEFLNRRPRRHGTFHTTSKLPDSHAAVDRATGVLWQALLGVRRFRGAGQMSVDEVFSPQQAIIDDEILSRVARVIRGLDPLAAGGDAVDEIAEGLETRTYLDLPQTVSRFREFCHFPKLFKHCSLGHWRAEGSPNLLAEAWRMAEEQIARCDFHLPEDQAAAVTRVYEKAVKAVI